MRQITIIGAGQAGLQLGLGLRQQGYDVTIVSDRAPDEILHGQATGAATLFETSIALEESLGCNDWDEAPPIKRMTVDIHTPDGILQLEGSRSHPWLTVDQRLKHSRWLRRFANMGGRVVVKPAGSGDLESYATTSDLVVVAAGARQIGELFIRDDERSVYDRPQRRLLQVYIHNARPWYQPATPEINLTILPGGGEIFLSPIYLNSARAGHSILMEIVPGTPLDQFSMPQHGDECLATVKRLIRNFAPWNYEYIKDARLADSHGWLAGAITPVVRHPVGRLPSGAAVFGIGDVTILNDPIGGQGANNATKFAHLLLNRIVEHEDQPFTPAWMSHVFEEFWTYSQYVNRFNTMLLAPPAPHQVEILMAASHNAQIAADYFGAFDNPPSAFPWFADPFEAECYLAAQHINQAIFTPA